MTTELQVDRRSSSSSLGDIVRFVVLSDIHATSRGVPVTNVAETDTAEAGNALIAATRYVAAEYGSADVVLCPGDLVHQGATAPVRWVWEQLGATAAKLGAGLIGSVGNHDLLRKPVGGQTPFQDLQTLRPRFPVGDIGEYNSYWSMDFGALISERVRVISMNTCATHGGYDESESEFGRLRPHSLDELAEYLEKDEDPHDVNLCMIHHHPVEWTHRGDKQRTHLQRGDLLIELLANRPERWIVVHGHKHHPRLTYLGGTTNGPVCLAAGSIGADVLGDTGTSVRNQMHVLEVGVGSEETLGLRLAGQVHSYDWEPGVGWSIASARSGLPARSGFGYRRDAYELLAELDSHIEASGVSRTIRWQDIVARKPRWAYLTPDDRAAFLAAVRQSGGGFTGASRDEDLEVTLP